jgi:hypothetical protein
MEKSRKAEKQVEENLALAPSSGGQERHNLPSFVVP